MQPLEIKNKLVELNAKKEDSVYFLNAKTPFFQSNGFVFYKKVGYSDSGAQSWDRTFVSNDELGFKYWIDDKTNTDLIERQLDYIIRVRTAIAKSELTQDQKFLFRNLHKKEVPSLRKIEMFINAKAAERFKGLDVHNPSAIETIFQLL